MFPPEYFYYNKYIIFVDFFFQFCFPKMFSKVYKLIQGGQFSTPTKLKDSSFLEGQFLGGQISVHLII